MPKLDPSERIKTIRAKVREERQLIAMLNRIIADPNLKRLLRPASDSLDDIESFFLDAKVLQQERTPAALARWLREAEKLLQRAEQQRKSFELIIKKFGPNARLVSG